MRDIIYGYAYYFLYGGFAERSGGTRDEFKAHPFRVTIDVPTEARRNNVLALILKTPLASEVKNTFAVTTFREYVKNPFGEIWALPGDYLEITKRTVYDPETHAITGTALDRDRMVAECLVKRALFVRQL